MKRSRTRLDDFRSSAEVSSENALRGPWLTFRWTLTLRMVWSAGEDQFSGTWRFFFSKLNWFCSDLSKTPEFLHPDVAMGGGVGSSPNLKVFPTWPHPLLLLSDEVLPPQTGPNLFCSSSIRSLSPFSKQTLICLLSWLHHLHKKLFSVCPEKETEFWFLWTLRGGFASVWFHLENVSSLCNFRLSPNTLTIKGFSESHETLTVPLRNVFIVRSVQELQCDLLQEQLHDDQQSEGPSWHLIQFSFRESVSLTSDLLQQETRKRPCRSWRVNSCSLNRHGQTLNILRQRLWAEPLKIRSSPETVGGGSVIIQDETKTSDKLLRFL